MSKYTKNILDKYCNDNNVELIKDYSNEKIWCELSIEGKCSNSECVNIFKKSSSEIILIEGILRAFSSLLPASSPATR